MKVDFVPTMINVYPSLDEETDYKISFSNLDSSVEIGISSGLIAKLGKMIDRTLGSKEDVPQ